MLATFTSRIFENNKKLKPQFYDKMGAPRGNKNGRLFSKTRQPGKRPGRKPSLINEFVKEFNMEDESRQISREDANKLLWHMMCCNKTDFEAMSRNTDLPISILSQIFAIAEDLKNKRTNTVDKIWDRLYGKSPLKVELSGPQGIPLIPKGPMSRKDYEKLLDELESTGTISKK